MVPFQLGGPLKPRNLPNTVAFVSIATLCLVIAGGEESLLIAQSTATVAVYATVLPSAQVDSKTASPMLSFDVEPAAAPATAGQGPRAALEATVGSIPLRWSALPGWVVSALPRSRPRGGPRNANGRPEPAPTVRITLAYTAN